MGQYELWLTVRQYPSKTLSILECWWEKTLFIDDEADRDNVMYSAYRFVRACSYFSS